MKEKHTMLTDKTLPAFRLFQYFYNFALFLCDIVWLFNAWKKEHMLKICTLSYFVLLL